MQSIIEKTIRQFLGVGKKFDENKCDVYCKFAHGGVPRDMTVNKLISTFTKLNDPSNRITVIASAQTATTSTVPVSVGQGTQGYTTAPTCMSK